VTRRNLVSESWPSPRIRWACHESFSPVSLAHDRCGDRMNTGLVVRPDRHHSVHHQRIERREELLQEFADIVIFLGWPTYHRCRKDGVFPVVNLLDLEDWIFMCQRIVAVMIAERPLPAPFVRWNRSAARVNSASATTGRELIRGSRIRSRAVAPAAAKQVRVREYSPAGVL